MGLGLGLGFAASDAQQSGPAGCTITRTGLTGQIPRLGLQSTDRRRVAKGSEPPDADPAPETAVPLRASRRAPCAGGAGRSEALKLCRSVGLESAVPRTASAFALGPPVMARSPQVARGLGPTPGRPPLPSVRVRAPSPTEAARASPATTPPARAKPGSPSFFRGFVSSFSRRSTMEDRSAVGRSASQEDCASEGDAGRLPQRSNTSFSLRDGYRGEPSENGDAPGSDTASSEPCNALSLMEEAEARSSSQSAAPRHQTAAENIAASAAEAAMEDGPAAGGGACELRSAQRSEPPGQEDGVPSHPPLDTPPPPPAEGTGRGGGSAPAWLTEWRLRRALEHKEHFEDLFLRLTNTAAHCYALSGRRRSATLLQSEAAALLLATDRPHEAVALFQQQAKAFAEEGWHALLAGTLPELIACLKPLGHPSLPHWLAKLLSMPQEMVGDRSAVQRELVRAADGVKPVQSKSARRGLISVMATPERHARSCVRPDDCIRRGIPGAEAVMDAVGMLVLTPAAGSFTRMFGAEGRRPDGAGPWDEDCEGGPVQGPVRVASVGDAEEVRAELFSHLPEALALEDVSLTLSISVPADAQSRKGGKLRGCEWVERGELHCPLSRAPPGVSSVEVAPGANLLRFSAYPEEPGLYSVKCLTARLRRMTLLVCAARSPPRASLRRALGAGAPGPCGCLLSLPDDLPPLEGPGRVGQGSAGPGADSSSRGDEVPERCFLFHVCRGARRLGVSSFLCRGCLIAGHSQWLGVCVRPCKDTLSGCVLQLWTTREHGAEAGVALAQGSPWALVTPLPPLDGAAADGTGGGLPEASWVQLQGGSVRLPAWAASAPSVTWVRAEVGRLELSPKTVQVPTRGDAALRAASSPLPELEAAGSAPLPPSAADGREAADEEADAPGLGTLEAEGSAEVEVEVRYESGCHRSHSCLLGIPLALPFRMEVAADFLPEERISVEVALTNRLGSPVMIRSARLQLQNGLSLEQDWVEAMGFLPATVSPAGKFQFLYFLRQSDRSERCQDRQVYMEHATALELEYELLPGNSFARATEVPSEGSSGSAGGEAHAVELEASTSGPCLRGVETPSCPEGHASCTGEGAAGPPAQRHTLRRCFTIDAGGKDTSPEMIIATRLLGPFTAVQRKPINLCWKVERAGSSGSTLRGGDGAGPSSPRPSPSPGDPCEVIMYEIIGSSAWRCGGPRRGQIWLPRAVGATATVEAEWTPLQDGRLPIPRLQLRGVAWQERPLPSAPRGEDSSGAGSAPCCTVMAPTALTRLGDRMA